MIHPHHLAYAQARVQARFAKRLGEPEWQRLGAVQRFGPYLRELRATGLGDWVAGIAEGGDPHEIEQALRRGFRLTLDEVVGWTPEPWRPAIAWVGWLPLLPLLRPLVLGETASPWALRDPELRPWLDGEGRLRPAALVAAGGADLFPEGSSTGLGGRWRACWERRWPAVSREGRLGLERLWDLLATRWSELPPGAEDPRVALRLLGVRLEQRFHRLILQPAMPFAYLALVALDLRRLRGELLGRALFQGAEGVA